MNDKDYMQRAMMLAQKGAGWTSPNPMVGAVIVKDCAIIGEGYHRKYGALHAEREALAACTTSPEGATMYVTLEPCCHQGKQPPCTDAILESGIKTVVVGSSDPNPLVSGKGVEMLRANGIEVRKHVEEEECDAVNAVFFHYIRTGLPFVVLKFAMTLDGKTATRTGASQWITGEAARTHVQQVRGRYAAIMAGVSTVLADDPRLTCRMAGMHAPVRIICDTHLRTPVTSQVVQTAWETPTILATCQRDAAAHAPFLAHGCEIMVLPSKDGHVDIASLMQHLGARGIDSVLVEGGATLAGACLDAGFANRVMAYIAPKLFGGADAHGALLGVGVARPNQAMQLTPPNITPLGEDVLLECEVKNRVHRDC